MGTNEPQPQKQGEVWTQLQEGFSLERGTLKLFCIIEKVCNLTSSIDHYCTRMVERTYIVSSTYLETRCCYLSILITSYPDARQQKPVVWTWQPTVSYFLWVKINLMNAEEMIRIRNKMTGLSIPRTMPTSNSLHWNLSVELERQIQRISAWTAKRFC